MHIRELYCFQKKLVDLEKVPLKVFGPHWLDYWELNSDLPFETLMLVAVFGPLLGGQRLWHLRCLELWMWHVSTAKVLFSWCKLCWTRTYGIQVYQVGATQPKQLFEWWTRWCSLSWHLDRQHGEIFWNRSTSYWRIQLGANKYLF